MKILEFFSYLSAGFISVGSLSFVLLKTVTTSEIKNVKNIEVFFYKKTSSSTTSSSSSHGIVSKADFKLEHVSATALAATSTSTTSELFAKVKIPIASIEQYKKYEYCLVTETTGTAVSTTAANAQTTPKDCTYSSIQSKLRNDDKIAIFVAKTAHYYIEAQHHLNILNASDLLKSTSSTTAATTTTPCTCTCASGATSGCTCTAGKDKCCCSCCSTEKKCTCTTDTSGKCCCNCCIADITCATEDEKKNFLLYISNLYSSYQNKYFSPSRAYLYFDTWPITELTTSTTKTTSTSDTSSSSTTTNKTFRGFLIYNFIDNYYKVINDPTMDWLKKQTKISSNTVQTTDTTSTQKYFINYPICFKYNIKDQELDIDSSNTTNDIASIHKEIENKSKLFGYDYNKTSTSTTNKQLINLKNCSFVGKIEPSKITTLPTTIFDKVCACSK